MEEKEPFPLFLYHRSINNEEMKANCYFELLNVVPYGEYVQFDVCIKNGPFNLL